MNKEMREVLEKSKPDNLQIYQTTEYDKFKLFPCNRIITDGHVRHISDSENFESWMRSCPIIVNEDFYIIDGQHRFAACKKMHLPIYYTIREGAEVKDIIPLQGGKPWRIEDYIRYHALNGNLSFRFLLDFRERYQ